MWASDIDAQFAAAKRSRWTLARSVAKERVCERLGLPSVFSNYYDTRQCIYIHIPKCAGTSVASVLYGRSPWHFRMHDVMDINPLKWCRYFSFATAREPLSRLYSIYKYAAVDHSRYRLSPLKPTAKMSFEKFVDCLTRELVESFPFLRPQRRFVYEGSSPLVDEVVRIEEMGQRLPAILERLGIDEKVQFLNVTRVPGEDSNAVYSNAMRRKVEALYAEDFLTFGY